MTTQPYVVTLNSLTPGVNYGISVRALYTDGTYSDWSKTVEFSKLDASPPPQPSFPTVWKSNKGGDSNNTFTVIVKHSGLVDASSARLPSDTKMLKVYVIEGPDGTLVDGKVRYEYLGEIQFVNVSGADSVGKFTIPKGTANTEITSGKYYYAEPYIVVTAVDYSGNESVPSDPPKPPSGVDWFDNAYISDLVADKITTGTLQASTSITVGTANGGAGAWRIGQAPYDTHGTIQNWDLSLDDPADGRGIEIDGSGYINILGGRYGPGAGEARGIILSAVDNSVSENEGYMMWWGSDNWNATKINTDSPFSISKTGVLKATGANITGAITATSGSFTGAVTATSGQIGSASPWYIGTSPSSIGSIQSYSLAQTYPSSGTSGVKLDSSGFIDFYKNYSLLYFTRVRIGSADGFVTYAKALDNSSGSVATQIPTSAGSNIVFRGIKSDGTLGLNKVEINPNDGGITGASFSDGTFRVINNQLGMLVDGNDIQCISNTTTPVVSGMTLQKLGGNLTVGKDENSIIFLKGLTHLLDGTVTAPSISFDTQTNLGLFKYSGSVIGVTAGGTRVARFGLNNIYMENPTTFTREATFGGQVLAINGTNTSPSISFSNETNTGLYLYGSATLDVVVGGVRTLEFYNPTTGSNTVSTIGNTQIWSPAVYSDAVSGKAVYVNSSGHIGISASTRRVKSFIQEIDDQIMQSRLLDLNIVKFKYNFDVEELGEGAEYQLGFIAEQAQELGLDFLYQVDSEGIPDYFAYDKMPMYLLALAKKQQARIDDLESRLAVLENK